MRLKKQILNELKKIKKYFQKFQNKRFNFKFYFFLNMEKLNI